MSQLSKNTQYLQLEDYDYNLPEELIAQEPSQKRELSRLLVIDKKNNTWEDACFSEIIKKLPKNALIIANNSRVVPARVLGNRESGSKIEMLIISPVPLLEQSATEIKETKRHSHKEENTQEQNLLSASSDTHQNEEASPTQKIQKSAVAQVLLKGAKRVKIGEEITFHTLNIKIIEKQDFGKHIVELSWHGSLVEELEKYGSLPLPPYIKRPEGPNNHDMSRYQTVYANDAQSGSVAAPTAGLHFTKEIQKELLENGFLWEEVTLHVGYGTFSPVRAENIREHDMHAEYVEIPEKTAKAIIKAKAENRPIITIGTTATRSVEGMAQAYHNYKTKGACSDFTINTISPHKPPSNTEKITQKQEETEHDHILPAAGCFGYTNIFIYPGKEFKVIDGLLTNFHLPKSSLLMLVCAFAGYEKTLEAYKHAIEEKYRFFSYGDAMLIRP